MISSDCTSAVSYTHLDVYKRQHPDCENTLIRAIAGSENGVNTASETVRFALKPGKVFLFDKNNGERIREAWYEKW